LSDEDLRRVSQYQENIERQKLQTSLGNYEDYLESLEQRAIIRHFEEKHLDRITQLINKTNQFNLTTLRLSRSQVEERMRSPDMLTAYVRLADRFGDNGLISVLCAERDTDELWIQIWLMS
jgi:FkbH-like protein